MEVYLSFGMVSKFEPTDSLLVSHYLFNKLNSTPYSDQPTFPEICIYGQDASPPWEIWSNYQDYQFPHQDYIYFFSKNEKHKSRYCRQVGSTGGTWSESDSYPIFIDGVEGEFGLLRKFRFEKTKKRGRNVEEERDVRDEQHGAWLMDECTINQQPNLALCRLKANKSTRGIMKTDGSLVMRSPQQRGKKRRAGISIASSPICEEPATPQEMPSTSYHHEDHQMDLVVFANRCDNFSVELNRDGNLTFPHGNILMNRPNVQPQPSSSSFPNDNLPIQMSENHENQTCCSSSPEFFSDIDDEIQQLMMNDENANLASFSSVSTGFVNKNCVGQLNPAEDIFDEILAITVTDAHRRLSFPPASFLNDANVEQHVSTENYSDEFAPIPTNDDHGNLIFSPFWNDAVGEQQGLHDIFPNIDEHQKIVKNYDHGNVGYSPDAVFLNEVVDEQLDNTYIGFRQFFLEEYVTKNCTAQLYI